MSDAFNIKPFAAAINAGGERLTNLEKAYLEDKVEAMLPMGEAFHAIVLHEQGINPKIGNSAVYKKHEKLFPKVSQTILVTEAYAFYLAGKPAVTKAITKYRRVGLGPDDKKADGTFPMQTRKLATAIVAQREGTWGDNGVVKSTGNRAKTKATRRNEAEAKVTALAEAWGDTFDFRYFTSEELAAAKVALVAEEARRELGGKVLVASAA